MSKIKKFLIGNPISSAEEQHQRLRKAIALPVFASDAISSTAYATDEAGVYDSFKKRSLIRDKNFFLYED